MPTVQHSLAEGFSFGGPLQEVLPADAHVGGFHNNSDSVDMYWMKEALRESMKSVGRCNPNPAVGCVIVKNGREIARGHTQAYGGKHAERAAIENLADLSELEGATAYVTLEPCSHHGHQPPCSALLADLPLERVVIARTDSDPRVSGRGVQQLLKARKKISIGILSEEVTAWNYPFFRTRSSNRPFIALKWAQTLDGQLADDTDQSKWISGPTARAYTHWLRQKYDAVLVGAGTFLKDLSQLTVRNCPYVSKQPLKLVFDPNASLLRASACDQQKLAELADLSENPYFILVKSSESIGEFQKISNKFIGIEISGDDVAEQIFSALSHSRLQFAHGRVLQSLLVEGGPRLLTELAGTDVVDILHVFVSPVLTGGSKHRISLDQPLASASRFEVLATRQLGNDALLELVKREAWEKTLETAEAAECSNLLYS